jgi:hypothetical protein
MQLLWQQQQQQQAAAASAPPRVTLLPDAAPAGALPAPLPAGASHVASALGAVGYSVESDPEGPSPPATPSGSRRERRRARRAAAATEQAPAPAWAEVFPGAAGSSSVDATVEGGSASGSSRASGAMSSDEAESAPPLPKHVQELAAAIALVNNGDVLTDDLDLPALRRRRASASGTEPGTPAATAPAAASTPSSPQQPTAPAAEPRGASRDGEVPLETVRGAPGAPPPLLAPGDDDIYWVAKLHGALEAVGCYAPDEEVEDFYFGGGTQGALLSFQACNGLDETGKAAAGRSGGSAVPSCALRAGCCGGVF